MSAGGDLKEAAKLSAQITGYIYAAYDAYVEAEDVGYHGQHNAPSSVEMQRLSRAAAAARVLAKRLSRIEETVASSR